MRVYMVEWWDGVEFVIPRESIPPGVYKTKVEIESCMDDLLKELMLVYRERGCGEKG
ncbi:MAG: hypothetical protein V3V84_08805 [Candidatus Bathyarchaeia archaeon]